MMRGPVVFAAGAHDVSPVSDRPVPRPPIDPAALNADPRDTMWTNLGYWPGAATYAEAAAALALRVGQAAQLHAGDVVVDYACGYGDSLRLWVERFAVARVIGVEPDAELARTVRERIHRWGLTDRITIESERAERTAPDSLAGDVTAVVCVDGAYHFDTRRKWLLRTLQALPSGGRLGIADLVFAARAAGSWRVAGLARLVNVPAANLETTDQLETTVTGAGARIRWSEGAGEAVLDGFCRNVPARNLPIELTRRMIRFARRGRLVDYRIIGCVRE